MTQQSTTVHQVRYTDPDAWLREFRMDLNAGEIEGTKDTGIVRLAVMHAPATIGEIDPRRSFDNRPGLNWSKVWVEASYVSTRRQLVKLSVVCGVRFTGPETQRTDRPGAADPSEATQERERELTRKLQRELEKAGVDRRGGGLYVEDGPWSAGIGDVIADPAVEHCATCGDEIYFANGWRHRSSGQSGANDENPCPDCGGPGVLKGRRCQRCRGLGVIKVFNHYADPELVGLQILSEE